MWCSAMQGEFYSKHYSSNMDLFCTDSLLLLFISLTEYKINFVYLLFLLSSNVTPWKTVVVSQLRLEFFFPFSFVAVMFSYWCSGVLKCCEAACTQGLVGWMGTGWCEEEEEEGGKRLVLTSSRCQMWNTNTVTVGWADRGREKLIVGLMYFSLRHKVAYW